MTLDGLQYTFNNLGEFNLLKAKDGTFSMQGRTSLVTKTETSNSVSDSARSTYVNATQFTSLAFYNGTVTVELNVIDTPTSQFTDSYTLYTLCRQQVMALKHITTNQPT